MTVYILEERVKGTDYDTVGVVTRRDVADLFTRNKPLDRRWRLKWLDDVNLLYQISKEGSHEVNIEAAG